MARRSRVVLTLLMTVTLLAGAGTGTLATTAAPQPTCDWSGIWETAFLDDTDGEEGTTVMQLNQSGDAVTGSYDFRLGVIAGVAAGPILSGSWMQGPSYRAPEDLGEFEFTVGADCSSYAGRWRYAGDKVWSTWIGQRRP